MNFEIELARIGLDAARKHFEFLGRVKDRESRLLQSMATSESSCDAAIDAWEQQAFEVIRCELLLKKSMGETV